MKRCLCCESERVKEYSILGVTVIYGDTPKDQKTFHLYQCVSCGFVKNESYKGIDFLGVGYDNFSPALSNDARDTFLTSLVYSSLCGVFSLNEIRSASIVEIGAGRRLGFIKNLQQCLGVQAWVADPSYTKSIIEAYEKSSCGLRLVSNYSDVDVTNSDITVVTARNSLEYFNPNELSMVLTHFFRNNGLFFTEMSLIDYEKRGSIHMYTECKCFYTIDSLINVFKGSGLKLTPIISAHVYGDERVLLIGSVDRQEASQIQEFSSVRELSDFCQRTTPKEGFTLWGAGGRNVMFFLNEGQRFIQRIVDADASREGEAISSTMRIEPISAVAPGDTVILLNSRFLREVQSATNYLCPILMLSPTSQIS